MPLKAELPELDEDICCAPTCPKRALGACFGDQVPAGTFTYFGCDRNVTSTHFDRAENLLLCVYGSKRLWLYPPSDAPFLYPAGKDASRSAAPPFQRYADLEPRVQGTFPQLVHASPIEANLVAGDVLYLPSCWWHCVEGSRERNMILNWWMSLHPKKSKADGTQVR